VVIISGSCALDVTRIITNLLDVGGICAGRYSIRDVDSTASWPKITNYWETAPPQTRVAKAVVANTMDIVLMIEQEVVFVDAHESLTYARALA
jgi:hypothetical protein